MLKRPFENRRGTIWNLSKQLPCKLGFHRFVLLESVGSFGAAGSVQKLRCERCGTILTKRQD